MVVLAVELGEVTTEVGAHITHDLLAVVEDGVGEDSPPIFGDEHQVGVAVPNSMAATAYRVIRGHDTNATLGSVLKRYRYRAYPDGSQQKALARVFGCVRVVFNDVIAARRDQHRAGAPFESASVLQSRLVTAAKSTPERAWLAEVSATPLQQAVRDADRAYRNFFDSVTGKRKGRKMGAPRFKKRTNRQSARFTRQCGFTVCETSHGVAHLRVPKVGWVRYAASRPLPSDPSSVTVICEPDGRYYVSFVVDEPATPAGAPTRVAGVDVGLTHLAAITYSDGTREKITNPRWARTRARKLARAQRSLARKQKGSNNRDKARRRVAVEHRKVRDARLDHQHKLARRLVCENQAVVIEGLNTAGLGRTRLARSIHDAAWAILLRLITEKATTAGAEIIVADRFMPSSQTCAVCGHHDGRKPLTIRHWTCIHCGTRLDRDWNAATNLMMLAAGLAESENACGDSVRRTLACAESKKQEPAEQTVPTGTAA